MKGNAMTRLLGVFVLSIWMLAGHSQQFMLLEKPGTFRNFKYFEGDDIMVVLLNDNREVSGTITRIADSVFVINNQEEFAVSEVKSVVRTRFFFSFFGYGAMVGGSFYFTLDVVNRALNGDSPVVTSETAIIGASLAATGWLLSQFRYRHYPVGEKRKWRLRIMPSIAL